MTTSGARAVTPFWLDGELYLAIPQLAKDIAGKPAGMNEGDSDVPLILYRHDGRMFVEHQQLSVSGGEDAEFFQIGDRSFLATASVRSGHGPYDVNVDSIVFEWRDGKFEPFQRIPTFAAKQWRYFEIGDRRFLALAQNVNIPGVVATNPRNSTIFEWNGKGFESFQVLDSAWGYNFLAFQIRGDFFLAYADHAIPSVIMRWDGKAFKLHQTLPGLSGRAFCHVQVDNDVFLVFAKLLEETIMYRWNGSAFIEYQKLSGPGGREFAYLEDQGNRYLIQVNFQTGARERPNTVLQSVIYWMNAGKFEEAQRFTTSGGTDVATFSAGGKTFVAVSESLTADIRFDTASKIYQFRNK